MSDAPPLHDPHEAILIHDAWQGSWVWGAVAPMLAAAGWRCHAIDLPGNGADGRGTGTVRFDDHRAHLARVVEYCRRPVHIVAHGESGVLAAQIAEDLPDQVAQIVHVCGLMLPSGLSFPDLVAPFAAADPAAAGIAGHLVPVPGGTVVPPAAALEIFYHDCRPEAALAAAARLTPWPSGVAAPRARLTARFSRVRRTYVECLADRAVVPAVQREMQRLVPGAVTASLPCGHAPMLAAPEALARVLLDSLAP
jgi:pimeloyl-ACP methyl ester carboxylesterase